MNQQRATTWSLTINNPTDSDREAIALAGQKRWTVTGQEEVGSEGTRHLQLMLKTPQIRFSAVKKHFKRAHIEIAHHPAALEKYVNKEDTRVAKLDCTEKYPSQAKTMSFFGEHIDRIERMYEICLQNEPRRLLAEFDRMCEEKIKQGYYMELIAMNPQVRAAIKSFGYAIVIRHRRQTARQTALDNLAGSNITNGETEDIPAEEEGGTQGGTQIATIPPEID